MFCPNVKRKTRRVQSNPTQNIEQIHPSFKMPWMLGRKRHQSDRERNDVVEHYYQRCSQQHHLTLRHPGAIHIVAKLHIKNEKPQVSPQLQ
jgi:hypothetical protein